MTKSYQTIWLNKQTPQKPAPGAPCNGCGVCCAISPCPLARVRFLRFWRPLPAISRCPALVWSDDTIRYECGLLSQTATFWPFIPSRLQPYWQRAIARWIATGIGCDSTTEIDTTQAPSADT